MKNHEEIRDDRIRAGKQLQTNGALATAKAHAQHARNMLSGLDKKTLDRLSQASITFSNEVEAILSEGASGTEDSE